MFNPVKVITGRALSGGRPRGQRQGCPPSVFSHYRGKRPIYIYGNGTKRSTFKEVAWSPELGKYIGVYTQVVYHSQAGSYRTETYKWLYDNDRRIELGQHGVLDGRRQFAGF